ncbi:MAG: hypothetical protein WC955_10260 [Elusimicrobiota bacterium]
MKITFPYMGNIVIVKKILDMLGHDTLLPPIPSQRTIELGSRYSPEFACFPFKVIMGTYIETIEQGAGAIITTGGCGPCRAGYYGEVHKKILKSLGYDIDIIVIDGYSQKFDIFWESLMKIKARSSWLRVLHSLWVVYHLGYVIDAMEKFVCINRAYELTRGALDGIFVEAKDELDKHAWDAKSVKRIESEYFEKLKAVPLRKVEHPEDRIRVGLVGEIYVVMEPSITRNIDSFLASQGCEVYKNQYLSEWMDHNMWPKFMARTSDREILKKGARYIGMKIGGHEVHTLGNTIDYKDKGFDGVIHLMPFACLPELVSQSIFPKLSKDMDIPVLTLAIDEQSGLANNLTRIEAFVELIKAKKVRKKGDSV